MQIHYIWDYVFRYSSGASSTSVPGATPALIKLLDLVDKYWNGSKSLHDNKKFMSKDPDTMNKFVQETIRQKIKFYFVLNKA